MFDESNSEDRLYLFDASRSMNERLKNGERKIKIVKDGLKEFCLERWPESYYDLPLRIGIVAFRLLGTPGETRFEEIVPPYSGLPSLPLYLLDELSCKGGSPMDDALNYALIVMNESMRPIRRLYFISDGENDGSDPKQIAERIGKIGIELKSIQIADNESSLMVEIAKAANGNYYLVSDIVKFKNVIF